MASFHHFLLLLPLFLHSQSAYFIFALTNPFLLAPSGTSKVCANAGRFLGTFCLADYNCDKGRPGSKQVCIRGCCCTKTRTSKASANLRTAEDRVCPRDTFNVGFTCSRTQDCLRKAKLPPSSPFPLLECVPRGKMCCTNSRYKTPLAKGDWCLNGGKALGRMNGYRECVRNEDCRNGQRPRALCVDRQCCTPPIRGTTGRQQQQMDNGKDEEEEDEEGEDREGEEEEGEDDDVGDDQEGYFPTVDDDGLLPRVAPIADPHLREGRRICRGYGLPYLQVRRCSRRLSCGDSRRFRCISTHCCLRRTTLLDAEEEGGEDEEEEDVYDDDDKFPADETDGNSGRIPSGAYCLGTGRFRRFLGQFCTRRMDCPRVLDARRRAVPIRCIRGACCAALRRNSDYPFGQREEEGGGGTTQGRLLPLRPANVFAFCFDGTLSRRQCFSPQDCPFPNRQSCVNNLCCAPTIDQAKYACGGLASAGQCTATISLPTSASCRDNLFCLSPGACCECRHGQPQKGATDCRRRRGQCKSGYACDQGSGFCCPRCAGGQMPFGSCYLGKCARGFLCRPGNICCERWRRRQGTTIDEEEGGEEEEENYNDEDDGRMTGRGRKRRRREGRGGNNPLLDTDWDMEEEYY